MGKLRGLESIWKNSINMEDFFRVADADGYDKFSVAAFLQKMLNVSEKEARAIANEYLNWFPYYNGRG